MAISTPLAILLTLALAHTVLCQPKEEEDTFCEEDNCYDVMGLAPGASSKQVRAAYRKLSKEVHPDNAKEGGSEARFQQVARAYGVLKDGDRKKQYDQYLYSPSSFPYMRRFKKSKPSPKVGVIPLLFGVVAMITIVQYVLAYFNQSTQIARMVKIPELKKKYKKQADDKKLLKGKTKSQAEEIIKSLIAADLPPVGLGDTIILQFFSFVKFSILGQTPSDTEKIKIISGYIGINPEDWAEKVSAKDQKAYLEGDTWKKEVFFAQPDQGPKPGSAKSKREKRQAKKNAGDPLQYHEE